MLLKSVRLIVAMTPVIALSACGSSREQILEQQLAQAKAQALEEAAAHKAALREAQAAKARIRDAGLSAFYGNDDGGGEDSNQEETSDNAVADVVAAPEAAEQIVDGPGNDEPDA